MAVGSRASLKRFNFGDVEQVYNTQKGRIETWMRGESGDEEWVLHYAEPARVWEDSFITGGMFYPTLLGVNSQLQWSVNGRLNGANDPDGTCFVSANEIGGGLSIIANTGGTNDDYTAVHFGDSYPTDVSHSPHMKITADFEANTDCCLSRGLG